jgi:lysophospholipase L1-like esterase
VSIKNIAIGCAGVLVAAAAGAVLVGRLRKDMTAGAAILNETLPVNSKFWRDRAKLPGELLYVAIGDSAAQGIGASAPDHSYVGILANDIQRITGRSVRVRNLSISGATVALAVADQLPRFLKLKPDIVTVAIGANNITNWNPAEFESGIRTIFGALPQTAIVADLPCFYLPHNERKVAVANSILRRVAAEHHLTVVPLHETMQRQGILGILTQFAPDRFHPNNRGYRVWASAFQPTLAAQLAERFLVQGAHTNAAADARSTDTDAVDAAGIDTAGIDAAGVRS